MGTFSWIKADKLTKYANVIEDRPFKMLIPKEFGGGYIKDNYQGYGRIGRKKDGNPKYDMYELVAFWNSDRVETDKLKYNGSIFPHLKEIDEYTNDNRSLGINISSSESKINKLKYPLKLVSSSFKGTYEDIGPSYDDPNQGYPLLRIEYDLEREIRSEMRSVLSREILDNFWNTIENKYGFDGWSSDTKISMIDIYHIIYKMKEDYLNGLY